MWVTMTWNLTGPNGTARLVASQGKRLRSPSLGQMCRKQRASPSSTSMATTRIVKQASSAKMLSLTSNE
eukprot:6154615-Amphidinium_carterae.1